MIRDKGKSELAQLCFNGISHEFLLIQSSQSSLSFFFFFFPSYLFCLCETGDVNCAETVLNILLSFDTSTFTSDFIESFTLGDTPHAKGTPFQMLPISTKSQFQTEALLLQKKTPVSASPRVSASGYLMPWLLCL